MKTSITDIYMDLIFGKWVKITDAIGRAEIWQVIKTTKTKDNYLGNVTVLIYNGDTYNQEKYTSVALLNTLEKLSENGYNFKVYQNALWHLL